MMTRMLVLVALLSPAVLAIGEDTAVATRRIFDNFLAGKMDDILAMTSDDFYGRFDRSVPIFGGEFYGVAGMARHLEDVGHSVDISKFEVEVESADEFRRTTHVTWYMEGTAKHTGKSFTFKGAADMSWSRESPAQITRLNAYPKDSKSLKLALMTKGEMVFYELERAFIEGDIQKFKKMYSSTCKFECHGDFPGCEDSNHGTIDQELAFYSTFDFDVLRSNIIVGTDTQVVIQFDHNHMRTKTTGRSMFMSDDDKLIFVLTLGDDGKIVHYEATLTTDPSPWVFHVAA